MCVRSGHAVLLSSSSRCERLCGRRRQTVPSDDDVQYGYGCGLGCE